MENVNNEVTSTDINFFLWGKNYKTIFLEKKVYHSYTRRSKLHFLTVANVFNFHIFVWHYRVVLF